MKARDRLLSLPDWFSNRTAAALMDMSQAQADVYLSRWLKAGLVDSAGPRSGLYFNRVRCPLDIEHLRIHALRFAYPEATIVGASVLHAAGLITQIPSRIEVAVLEGSPRVALDGFAITERPASWFASLAPWLTHAGACSLGVRELTSVAAMADMIASGTMLDEDDLYLDEEEQLEEAKLLSKKLSSP